MLSLGRVAAQRGLGAKLRYTSEIEVSFEVQHTVKNPSVIARF